MYYELNIMINIILVLKGKKINLEDDYIRFVFLMLFEFLVLFIYIFMVVF